VSTTKTRITDTAAALANSCTPLQESARNTLTLRANPAADLDGALTEAEVAVMQRRCLPSTSSLKKPTPLLCPAPVLWALRDEVGSPPPMA
jgi:hypothetical protein